MQIKLVEKNEISALREMVVKTYKRSFESWYPQSWIDYCISRQTNERLTQKANAGHFYIAKNGGSVVGCAMIGDYYGKQDESCLFTFCVDPDYQKQGIGKALMKAIESDGFYTRAKRIVVPASIPALPFYIKLGYKHVDGVLNYEDGSFMLEKYKN